MHVQKHSARSRWVPASVLCVPSRSPVGRWDGGTSAEWQVCAESLESHKSLSLPTCRLVWVGGPGPPPRRFHGVLGISVLTQSGKHDSNPINTASRERLHPRGTQARAHDGRSLKSRRVRPPRRPHRPPSCDTSKLVELRMRTRRQPEDVEKKPHSLSALL